MKISIKEIIIQRVLELIVLCIAISAIITVLNVIGITKTEILLPRSLLIGTIVFAGINTYLSRECFYHVNNPSRYLKSNISAYFIFAFVNIVSLFLLSQRAYTWLFAITKFIRFAYADASVLVSACSFHLLMLLIIAFAPIGMRIRPSRHERRDGPIFILGRDEEKNPERFAPKH